eukprot:TRINITY_DN5997_c0_g2_i1.p3 TRINITY_DN5997_c0_g2~~TRINITY_DN5997_c0_g2_i1.p3  ORF type:complete len:207 (+),score=-7.37 TRINITY_DN5997_c0_g2_i1:1437-2057(+)
MPQKFIHTNPTALLKCAICTYSPTLITNQKIQNQLKAKLLFLFSKKTMPISMLNSFININKKLQNKKRKINIQIGPKYMRACIHAYTGTYNNTGTSQSMETKKFQTIKDMKNCENHTLPSQIQNPTIKTYFKNIMKVFYLLTKSIRQYDTKIILSQIQYLGSSPPEFIKPYFATQNMVAWQIIEKLSEGFYMAIKTEIQFYQAKFY